MRGFRREAQALRFPEGPWPGRVYWDWKLPLPLDLVDPPKGRQAIRARCAQVLIDAAKVLSSHKPPKFQDSRVVAILPLPHLFGGEICIFFEEDHFETFASRDEVEQRWTRLEGDSLIQRWDLRLPPGFEEAGYSTVTTDADLRPPTRHGEVWMIGEVGAR